MGEIERQGQGLDERLWFDVLYECWHIIYIIHKMSWKKYGGTNNLENLNNLVVNSIVADVLSVRQYYIGDWDICGALLVKDDATIYRNALIYGNLDISGDNTEIRGNSKISRNTEISGNLVVYDDTYLKKYLYFDTCGNTLVHGINHAFGFNKYNPTATIDISSDQIYTVKMQTSQNINRNIYAQNAGQQGITLEVDPLKTSINMFVDSSMNVGNGTVNAKLEYTKGGDFLLDVSNIMRVRPRMIFSRDISKNMNSNEEHVVIYDSSELRGVSYPYNYDIYGNVNLKSGVALTAISKDSSSNVFMKMTTEQGIGAVIGGGPFESGIMASLALIDSSANNFSNNIYPAFNVFSGNLISNLKTSIGINKHRVSKTDLNENLYSLDINGPIKLIHQELLETIDISMQINTVGISPSKKVVYAVGSPYQTSVPYKQLFLKSLDAGYTWSRIDISLSSTIAQNNFEAAAAGFNSIYVYDDNYVIISTGGLHFYTTNGGLLWNQITFTGINITINSFSLLNQRQNTIFGLSNGKFFDLDASTTPSIFASGISISSNIKDSSLNNITGVDGSGNIAFFVGTNGIQGYRISSPKALSPRFYNDLSFNDVSLHFDGSKYHVVAVGIGKIAYAHTSNHLSTDWVYLSDSQLSSKTFKKVKVVSELLAIALVDDVNNPIAYSNDGFKTWTYLTRTELNSMGNGFVLDNFIFSSIVSTNVNDFVIGGYYQPFSTLARGRSKMIHFHAPYLLNRDKNFVIEASGSILLSGDLNVTGNAKICTNYIDAESNSANNTLKIGNVHASKILIGSTDTTTDIRIGKTDGSLTGSRGTQARIHIGDLNSSVHIYGNLFVPGSVTSESITNLEVKNKSIRLNDEADNSSTGSGIYIRDNYAGAVPGNGVDDSGANVSGNNYSGQILVNSSRKGFTFKAPTSSKYINFDLDNFLVNFANGSDKGIVTIGFDSVNNFTVKQRDVQIMDIINLDVSLNRRVFRNAALTYNADNPNTQVIDDRLAMTGFMINKMQNQIITDTQMDVSGNAIITKLGLGTSSVNTNAYKYVLDISGNTWTNGAIIQW